MSRRSAAMLLVGGPLAGGLGMAVAYGARDGVLTAAFMLACGIAVLGAARVFAARRGRVGSLSRQFALGIAIVVGLSLACVAAVALLMFVSPHDALLMGLLLGFGGLVSGYAAAIVARGAMDDVRRVRDHLLAVGEGHREPDCATGASDELGELAAAANRMTVRLGDSEQRTAAASAAHRDLIAAVSHDLRTPLAALRVLVEALDDDIVDAETRRRYLRQLGVHTRSLTALVDDLFELSRLEAGEVEWSLEQVGIGELVTDAVEAMAPQADARGVRVGADLPPRPPVARANPEQLQRVLFNLVQNAIRHTPADGSVTVAAQARGGSVEIEVADDGEGIAADERDRVFEPFYRGVAQGRTGDGAGLGLTICRAIVEAHGGRIWLADSDRGARVRFSIPSAA